MLIESYRDLDVWKAAHQMVLAVYGETSHFPDGEKYGVTSQIRRSAVSIPANLAEGFGKRSVKDFLRYCLIANGSLQETSYLLLLSKDLGYLNDEQYQPLDSLAGKVGSLLGGLERSLRKQLNSTESLNE